MSFRGLPRGARFAGFKSAIAGGAPMYPECLGKHDYRDPSQRTCPISKARLRKMGGASRTTLSSLIFPRRGPSVAARMADAKFGGFGDGFNSRQAAQQPRLHSRSSRHTPRTMPHAPRPAPRVEGRKCSVEILGQLRLGFPSSQLQL